MRARIQRSMVFVLSITLLISYLVLTVVIYRQNLTLLKTEVRQEARYIKTAINISGPAYLEQMDEVDVRTLSLIHIFRLRSEHMKRLATNQCNTDAGIVYLDALVCLERISDHSRNIAEEVLTVAN